MKMKYIIFDMDGMEIPVIFPGITMHSRIADRLSWNPVSAGFVSLIEGKFMAYGGSMSLGIMSREEDAQTINSFFENK